MSKPRICFVAPHIFPILARDTGIQSAGGAEVQQTFLARALYQAGYGISVITNDFGQPDEMEVDGIRIIKIHARPFPIPFVRFFFSLASGLLAALKKTDADIYYQRSAGWPTGVVGWYAARHGKSFVYSVAHNLETKRQSTQELFNFSMGWRSLWLYRYGVKRSQAIVTQNPQQALDGRAWLTQQFYLIKSCYRPPGVIEPARHGGAVLWLATLRSWKRPELFIELARRLPHIEFILAGGADQGEAGKALYESIRQMAEPMPNVRLTGFLPYEQADSLFNGISLFVNTSDHEGFPNTFLQAWARGVPTVSFFDTGAQDARGKIGCVVDGLDAMAQAIQQMHEQPARWEEESRRCRDYFQTHHHIDSIVAQYDRLFMQLMRESAQS
jgi:glycosyltransferase involved in cell wall biosynthesis